MRNKDEYEDEYEDEEEFEEVEVKFSAEWTIKDRMKQLIKGSQLSADEIIRSLHQPMDLRNNRDEKYKAITEGRIYAIKAASEAMDVIEKYQTKLELMIDPSKEEIKTSGNLAEKFAISKK